MLATALFVCGTATSAALVSGGIAAIARHMTKHDGLSAAIGALAIPTAIITGLSYWLVTMEVDDPTPGNVILGSLVVLVITAPIAFFSSRFTVQFVSRRTK